MLLALDAGNTNVTIGAFDGEQLVGRWRLRTIYEQTVQATDPETGATLLLRRIEIRLFEKTR